MGFVIAEGWTYGIARGERRSDHEASVAPWSNRPDTVTNNVLNDLLPLLFAVTGIGLAFCCRRLPTSTAVALSVQAIPPAGFWLTTLFC